MGGFWLDILKIQKYKSSKELSLDYIHGFHLNWYGLSIIDYNYGLSFNGDVNNCYLIWVDGRATTWTTRGCGNPKIFQKLSYYDMMAEITKF